MIKILSYSPDKYNKFRSNFMRYFREDIKLCLNDSQFDEICGEIVQMADKGIISVDILLEEDEMIGFIIYQIDSPLSDWCEKEGFGFIRELYIQPERRLKGLGASLVTNAQNSLIQTGVTNIYLTSDSSRDFWFKMGYRANGTISAINKDPIWIKDLLK